MTVVSVSEVDFDPRASADAYAAVLEPYRPPPSQLLETLGSRALVAASIARLAPLEPAAQDTLRGTSARPDAVGLAACLVLGELGDADAIDRAASFIDDLREPADAKMFQLLWESEALLRPARFAPLHAATQRAASRVDHPAGKAALRAAFALRAVPDGDGLVARLMEGARGGYDDAWIAHALTRLGGGGDTRAFAALEALVHGPFGTTGIAAALEAGDRRIVRALQARLDTTADVQTQLAILAGLARLGEPDVPRTLALLESQPWTAVDILGVSLHGTADETAVRRLSELAASDPRLGELCARAMARIGGELGHRTALGLLARLQDYALTEVLWRVNGISDAAAIARLAAAGLGTEPQPGSESLEPADHSATIWGALARAGAVANVYPLDEDHEFPRHGRLIAPLRALAGDALPIEQVSEEPLGEGGDGTRLRCVCDGRLYEVTTRYEGRVYDIPGVLALLHRVLDERSDRRRFVPVSGDDIARFVFGDPGAIAGAVTDLFLVAGDDFKARRAELRALGEPPPVPMPADADALAIEIVAASPVDTTGLAARLASLPPLPAPRVDARPGWTTIRIEGVTAAHVDALGADAFASWFAATCASVQAHLARTVHAGGWAAIQAGELAGAISALDWLQYFGPAYRQWSAPLVERATRADTCAVDAGADGAATVRVAMAPFTHAWREIEDASSDLGVRLRAMPEGADEVTSHEARLRDVLPPAPRIWGEDEQGAMVDARTATLEALRTGFADDALFHRFRAAYAPDGVASAPLVDSIETWREYYGAEPTAVALRAAVRAEAHDPARPRLVMLTAEQLEGVVKAVAWGDMPIGDREVLVEYMVATEVEGPELVLGFTDRTAVSGFLMLTRTFLGMCRCAACAAKQARLQPEDA